MFNWIARGSRTVVRFFGLIFAVALTGCATTGLVGYAPPPDVSVNNQPFVYVQVTSDTATAFHWIVDTRWNSLGGNEPARQAALLASPVFGPEGINDYVPLHIGTRYRFIPICDGRPQWAPVIRQAFHDTGSIAVRCQ